jgi:hypothetical protein
MLASKIGLLGGSQTLVISSNQTNFNLHTALGSPSGAVRAVVVINSGVVVSSNNTSTHAFDEGPLPAGSSVLLINNGSIYGMGGAGGNGGNASVPTIFGETVTAGANGSVGGPALRLAAPTSIINATGEIFGGGGGGGGSGGLGSSNLSPDIMWAIGGSGGGGGRSGVSTGASSAGTATTGGAPENYILPGLTGSAGTSSASGAGGVSQGGSGAFAGLSTGAGGAGGDWGAAGASAGAGAGGLRGSAGSGGAAGKAVDLNGQSITWISGNDGARVKGAVS